MVVADAFFASSTAVVACVSLFKYQGVRLHGAEGWDARFVDDWIVNENVAVDDVTNLTRKRHEGNWDVSVAVVNG